VDQEKDLSTKRAREVVEESMTRRGLIERITKVSREVSIEVKMEEKMKIKEIGVIRGSRSGREDVKRSHTTISHRRPGMSKDSRDNVMYAIARRILPESVLTNIISTL